MCPVSHVKFIFFNLKYFFDKLFKSVEDLLSLGPTASTFRKCTFIKCIFVALDEVEVQIHVLLMFF